MPASLLVRADREPICADLEPYLGSTVDERVAISGALRRTLAGGTAAHPGQEHLLDGLEPHSTARGALCFERAWRARQGSR